MKLQFISMEVMQLITSSESWKYQILFNFFIFEIALRYKHMKVNIFPESSLSVTRVPQTKPNIFCSPSQHISFLLLKGWGFHFSFLKTCLFSYKSYLHLCILAHVHIHKMEFPQRINSVLMHQDFCFKHCEEKKTKKSPAVCKQHCCVYLYHSWKSC